MFDKFYFISHLSSFRRGGQSRGGQRGGGNFRRGGRGAGRGRGGRGRGRGRGRDNRPVPTAEELDAELDEYNAQVCVVIKYEVNRLISMIL